MKTKSYFTRGEYMAGLVLLVIIAASYSFYYLFDGQKPVDRESLFREEEFRQFAAEQQLLKDSIDSAKSALRQNYVRFARSDFSPADTIRKKKAMYEIVKLDINKCDTDELKVLPMFGSKRAAALVSYRDRLGGFYDFSQLKEVYALKSLESDFLSRYFFVIPSSVKKIDINTATYQDMVKHPYFDAYLTKTILNYRQKNGRINSYDELQSITHAYPELMERLKHYVVFETGKQQDRSDESAL